MKPFFYIASLAFVFTTGVLQSCNDPGPDPGPTLYDRMGGLDVIRAVTDDFIENLAADDSVNVFFQATFQDSIRTLNFSSHLTDQICEISGGPCIYKGKTMKNAHAGMNITDAQFDYVAGDMATALDENAVPQQEKDELMTALGGLRSQIVGQ